jgi:hypothetical protein
MIHRTFHPACLRMAHYCGPHVSLSIIIVKTQKNLPRLRAIGRQVASELVITPALRSKLDASIAIPRLLATSNTSLARIVCRLACNSDGVPQYARICVFEAPEIYPRRCWYDILVQVDTTASATGEVRVA